MVIIIITGGLLEEITHRHAYMSMDGTLSMHMYNPLLNKQTLSILLSLVPSSSSLDNTDGKQYARLNTN